MGNFAGFPARRRGRNVGETEIAQEPVNSAVPTITEEELPLVRILLLGRKFSLDLI